MEASRSSSPLLQDKLYEVVIDPGTGYQSLLDSRGTADGQQEGQDEVQLVARRRWSQPSDEPLEPDRCYRSQSCQRFACIFTTVSDVLALPFIISGATEKGPDKVWLSALGVGFAALGCLICIGSICTAREPCPRDDDEDDW